MKLNIVIPAYNEEGTIAETLYAVVSSVTSTYRIIVVNDGSTDRTQDVLDRFMSDNQEILVVNQPRSGFAQAIKNGLGHVPEHDCFVVMMADGCDDASQINEMRSFIETGIADVVVASRYIPGGRVAGGRYLKRFGSFVVNRFFSFATHGCCHDITNSFKMYKRTSVRPKALMAGGFDISLEMAWNAYRDGCRFKEIPTFWQERKQGVSKFGIFKEGLRYFGWMLRAAICR